MNPPRADLASSLPRSHHYPGQMASLARVWGHLAAEPRAHALPEVTLSPRAPSCWRGRVRLVPRRGHLLP